MTNDQATRGTGSPGTVNICPNCQTPMTTQHAKAVPPGFASLAHRILKCDRCEYLSADAQTSVNEPR